MRKIFWMIINGIPTSSSFQRYMASFDAQRSAWFGIQSKVYSVQSQLHELSAKRTAVAGLSLTKEETISYYTTLIGNFIKSIEHVARCLRTIRSETNAHAMVSFISAKELAGIEQAVLSGIAAANKAVDTLV